MGFRSEMKHKANPDVRFYNFFLNEKVDNALDRCFNMTITSFLTVISGNATFLFLNHGLTKLLYLDIPFYYSSVCFTLYSGQWCCKCNKTVLHFYTPMNVALFYV